MLEIIAIWFLWTQLGKLLNNKGYESTIWMQLLLVIAWLIGEFSGVVIYGIIQVMNGGEAGSFDALTYLCAILGAIIGAGIIFGIAILMPRKGDPVGTI